MMSPMIVFGSILILVFFLTIGDTIMQQCITNYAYLCTQCPLKYYTTLVPFYIAYGIPYSYCLIAHLFKPNTVH